MAKPLFKIILPGRMNPTVFMTEIVKAMKEESRIHEKMFELGTSTWAHKPSWKHTFSMSGGTARSKISTGDKPFLWVEAGTDTRWRRMSYDWVSKTRPRRLSSGPGAGRAEGFFNVPKPGIEARDFREVVAEIRQPLYEQKMANVFRMASVRLFSPSGTRLA